MTIQAVDHINIATQDLEGTRAFFVDVLGLAEGPRPPFDFPGYWLYAGERPVVHMQLAPDAVSPSKLSALNHFAFAVSDLDELIARMEAHSIRYRVVTVPGTAFRQAFLDDPNGVRVELNEAAALQGR
jgi:catechol 2,3-dioxygenase-like lactoylglutathione lyase family enzyme